MTIYTIIRFLLVTAGAYFLAKVLHEKTQMKPFLNGIVSVTASQFLYFIIIIIKNASAYTQNNAWGTAIGSIIKGIIPIIGPIINFTSSLSNYILFKNNSYPDFVISIQKNDMLTSSILFVLEIAIIVLICQKYKEKKENASLMRYACPKCGVAVDEDSKFCAKCGCNLEENRPIRIQ